MAHFVRSFNCKDEEHVLWLKQIGNDMTKTVNGERVNIIDTVKNNPLPGNPSIENPADFAYVHFQLCMKYANAVLNGDAWIPGK